KLFRIPPEQDAAHFINFTNMHTIIESFFTKLIVTHKLDEEATVNYAKSLGARHFDFCSRGFNEMFWDIFMACLKDELHVTMKSFDNENEHELTICLEKTFAWVIHNMRAGFQERKKKDIELKV
ncbi:hypothetical protein PMAYCL1PPCAC_26315, partial [Pristionchus mayeri]